MKHTILGTRIIVDRMVPETVSKGGIFIPDAATELQLEGIVIGAGVEVTVLVVGDKVLFNGFAGSNIKLDGRQHLVMDEADVIAILSKE